MCAWCGCTNKSKGYGGKPVKNSGTKGGNAPTRPLGDDMYDTED
jgi:hypothetical protein